MPNTNQYVNKVIVNGVTKIDLTGDTIASNKLLYGYTAHDHTGAPIEGSCTFDADTTDANATTDTILATKTAYVAGQKVTGSMPNRGGVTGTISTVAGEYTIANGYHDGSGKVSIDTTEQAKIIATNIREGITILGVEGTMTGTEDVVAGSPTVTPSFSTQTIVPDSTASPAQNYLSQVTVNPIPVAEADNEQGGLTLTIG